MTYTVVFKRSVLKDIRRIPAVVLRRIEDTLHALTEDPMPAGCARLQTGGNYFRIRVGNYRIVYEIDTIIRIVTIVRIGHRKDVYR